MVTPAFLVFGTRSPVTAALPPDLPIFFCHICTRTSRKTAPRDRRFL